MKTGSDFVNKVMFLVKELRVRRCIYVRRAFVGKEVYIGKDKVCR